jgi:membrane-associated phospholipid phosphatase
VPVLVLIVLALITGLTTGLTIWRYPWRIWPEVSPAEVAQAVSEAAFTSATAGKGVTRKLKGKSTTARSATERAVTAALVFASSASVLLGVLAYLIRTNSDLLRVDNAVAEWGNRHASPVSMRALSAVTQLGSIRVVSLLCVLLAGVELRRERSRWVVPFIVAVVGGEEVVANVIKQIVDRTRPSFNPAAATLGPAFPSGHATTAAAFYTCAALLLGRRRSRPTRAVLTGAAAGLAVAVAASRVLLDVHWLTDVIGGLALGWAWLAICGVAFGGHIISHRAAVIATPIPGGSGR